MDCVSLKDPSEINMLRKEGQFTLLVSLEDEQKTKEKISKTFHNSCK